MTTEILPVGMWQLTPSSTWLPAQALWRSSISIMFSPSLPVRAPFCCILTSLRGAWEIGVVAPEDLGEEGVDDHDHHEADRHGLGDRPADAHRAAFDVVAVVDPDTDDEESEDHGLDQGVAEVGEIREPPEVGEVDAVGDQADLKSLHHPAGEEAGSQRQHVHHRKHE